MCYAAIAMLPSRRGRENRQGWAAISPDDLSPEETAMSKARVERRISAILALDVVGLRRPGPPRLSGGLLHSEPTSTPEARVDKGS